MFSEDKQSLLELFSTTLRYPVRDSRQWVSNLTLLEMIKVERGTREGKVRGDHVNHFMPRLGVLVENDKAI